MKQKIRDWSRENALTLVFLSFMFLVTWTVEVIVRYV